MINSNWSTLAHQFIIANLAKQVIAFDHKYIEACKFPDVYATFQNKIEGMVNEELKQLRNHMRRFAIDVEEVERRTEKDEVVFLIKHGGYVSKETYWTVALRNATRDYLLSLSSKIG